MSPDVGNRKQLTTPLADLTSISPSFSPDGKRIVYVQFATTGAVPASLWIMNADGSDQHQLTSGTWNNYDINGNIINAASSANAPAWGPNNIIAFWSGIQHQEGQIWTINPDGSDRKQLTYNLNPADEPEWSPDGTKILYTSNASGSLATWLMNSDGSGAHVLTDIAGRSSGNDAAWRPSVTGNVTIGGGAGDSILGGAGNVTIGGVAGDTIVGGSGNYFIAADQGGQVIISGSAGNGTIWGGSGDMIQGGAGNVTIGGVAGDTIIGGT